MAAAGFCLAMTNTTQSIRYAGTAIAAVLAIGSTQGFAQDAAAPFPAAPEPAIVVPDIPAASPPTAVLPPELPAWAPAPASETVQAIPPEPAPSPSATVARTRATTPAPESAAPQSALAPRTEAVELEAAEKAAALPPVIAAQAVAEPIPPVAADPMVSPARDNTGIFALILGGLGLLALAIWGFIAIGRRKPVRRYAATKTGSQLLAQRIVEPVPAAPERLPGPSFSARPAATSGAVAHAGASVALPARVPESYAERDALMKRMIAARPDRANPFTDRGARTRRARLILQSLGRDFGQTEPWIDLSQYPNNWPELVPQRPAAA